MRATLRLLALTLLVAFAAPSAVSAQAVGNGNTPPFLIGYHVEKFAVTNATLTCTLAALCSVGTVTFTNAFADTNYRCVATSTASTAAVIVLPSISGKSTSGITVNDYAILALVAQSVTVEGLCIE